MDNLTYRIIDEKTLTDLEKKVNSIILKDKNAQLCGAMVVIPVPNGSVYYAQTILTTS